MPIDLQPLPEPEPIVPPGTAKLKARGPASPRRANCDCGEPLRTFAKKLGTGSLELVPTLYCPVCDEWQTIEDNFGRETLVSAPDPRPVERQLMPPDFKAMRQARVRHL